MLLIIHNYQLVPLSGITMFLANALTQEATYWPPASTRDEFGDVSFGTPQLILCRWQDVVELFRDEYRREFTSNAVVYVGSPVLRRGYLALGNQVAENPREVAYEIRQILVSPSLDGTSESHKVIL